MPTAVEPQVMSLKIVQKTLDTAIVQSKQIQFTKQVI